jgi:hypothetical protein
VPSIPSSAGEAPGPTGTVDPLLRLTLQVFIVLAVGAILGLYVASERTAEAFAWTIQPPLTAALLGAGYAGALVLFGVAVRHPDWSRVRSAVPAPLVLSIAMLATTVLHLDRFHLDAGGIPGVVAWTWLVVYVIVPPLLAYEWVWHRHRQVLRLGPSPPRWAVVVGWVAAAVSAGLGVALLVAPASAVAAAWPWQLTPLTARALGSWLLAGGAAIGHVVLDGDLIRVRPLLAALTVTGLFGLGAVLRYPGEPSGLGAGLVLAGLALVTALGAAGLLTSRAD